ncbi:MAG: FxsA family protein [Hyphomicrobiaceae bacterium]
MVLLIVLIAVPLLELAVLIKVGQWIGFWPTFGIVIGTFMIGASVLARSGLAAAFRVQEAMLKGEPPVAAMLDGALLAFAGVLLVTPGFIADTVGFALLLPPVRSFAAKWFARSAFGHFDVRTSHTTYETYEAGDPGPQRHQGDGRGSGPVIDGEFERLDERPLKNGDRRPPRDGGAA